MYINNISPFIIRHAKNNIILSYPSRGLSYEVGALGTSIEGPSDEVWDLLRRVIEISVESGAESALAQIKIGYFPGEEKSIASLTSKFRVNR